MNYICFAKGGLLRCESLPFTWRKLTFCAVKAYLLPFVDYIFDILIVFSLLYLYLSPQHSIIRLYIFSSVGECCACQRRSPSSPSGMYCCMTKLPG